MTDEPVEPPPTKKQRSSKPSAGTATSAAGGLGRPAPTSPIGHSTNPLPTGPVHSASVWAEFKVRVLWRKTIALGSGGKHQVYCVVAFGGQVKGKLGAEYPRELFPDRKEVFLCPYHATFPRALRILDIMLWCTVGQFEVLLCRRIQI